MKAKRKKNSRQRGSKTHGWGAMKKHRGAGNKGGRGKAGTGKRSDCRKPSVWGIEKYFGKDGFTPIGGSKYLPTCNIETLEQKYQKLLKEGMVKEEKGAVTVDLQQLGVEKLLSRGYPTKKWNITVKQASAHAVEKIKEKGGQVTVTLQSGEETAEASA